jgi:regulatory protein
MLRRNSLPELSLRARAVQLLARREHSRSELARKLAPHAQSREELETLLDDLVRQGFLSDLRYAESVARSRSARYGSQRVVQELRQKGLTDSVVEKVIAPLKDADLATARAVWEKKFGAPTKDPRERAKQIRFLQGRGFSLSTALMVVKGLDSE